LPKRGRKVPDSAAVDRNPASAADESMAATNLSLHDLFQQQVRTMLDRTDLDEEQKQEIMIAAACPCCGAGGMSFTAKIKRRS
jgi:hypothetical protein